MVSTSSLSFDARPLTVGPLVAALERAGYRVTEPRRAVVELIVAREGHFSAADLIADARTRRLGVGRATIFRALDLFTDLNVLERLDLPSGEHAYVPCEPVGHHHHLVCSSCARVADVEEVGLALEDVQRRTGWRVESHRLELYGRCPACQARRPVDASARRSPA
jgi:Fe2+ or Zn2+ uptake regulation protein